jgi:hypothetical protein
MEMGEPLIEEIQDQYDAKRQVTEVLPGMDRLITHST